MIYFAKSPRLFYIVFMKNNTTNSEPAQGAVSQEIDEKLGALTVDQVEKWLTEDLGRARSLLQAIHNDKNILRLIAIQFQGQAQNWMEKQKDQLKNSQ